MPASARKTSTDPTIRLQNAEKWPVVRSLIAGEIWKTGIGNVVLARQESEGKLVYSVFLVDVYCLGVKNAFWHAGSPGDFKELIGRIEETQPLRTISPECLVKVVRGAVEYAQSFGFRPHPDFRHAAMLLEGIDPAACTQEFTYGLKGKPFYIQGPHETAEQARAIVDRTPACRRGIRGPGGRPGLGVSSRASASEFAEYDALEEDDDDEE